MALCVIRALSWVSCYAAVVRYQMSYLHLEIIADVSTVELRADQFKFPVKQSLCVPVLVMDKMEELLIVGHGVHP